MELKNVRVEINFNEPVTADVFPSNWKNAELIDRDSLNDIWHVTVPTVGEFVVFDAANAKIIQCSDFVSEAPRS